MTDTDGVGVWLNVSSWMQDESRSRVKVPAVNDTVSPEVVKKTKFKHFQCMTKFTDTINIYVLYYSLQSQQNSGVTMGWLLRLVTGGLSRGPPTFPSF